MTDGPVILLTLICCFACRANRHATANGQQEDRMLSRAGNSTSDKFTDSLIVKRVSRILQVRSSNRLQGTLDAPARMEPAPSCTNAHRHLSREGIWRNCGAFEGFRGESGLNEHAAGAGKTRSSDRPPGSRSIISWDCSRPCYCCCFC